MPGRKPDSGEGPDLLFFCFVLLCLFVSGDRVLLCVIWPGLELNCPPASASQVWIYRRMPPCLAQSSFFIASHFQSGDPDRAKPCWGQRPSEPSLSLTSGKMAAPFNSATLRTQLPTYGIFGGHIQTWQSLKVLPTISKNGCKCSCSRGCSSLRMGVSFPLTAFDSALAPALAHSGLLGKFPAAPLHKLLSVVNVCSGSLCETNKRIRGALGRCLLQRQ